MCAYMQVYVCVYGCMYHPYTHPCLYIDVHVYNVVSEIKGRKGKAYI